jgi:hypothetical protein
MHAELVTLSAAEELNRRGIKTAAGSQWHAMQVTRTRETVLEIFSGAQTASAQDLCGTEG